MRRQHFLKYLQKYYILICSATALFFIFSCNVTKKVPAGDFLLIKNNVKYTDGKIFGDQIPSLVAQKPNKKTAFLFPLGLWIYNTTNPKYDSILNEYMTYPKAIRNQKLRDSLFVKYDHPEYVGKNLFWNRFFHSLGQPPVILDQGKTQTSANSIRKYLVFHGYWDSEVKYKHDLDSAAKKAQVNYLITHKDPTFIKEYFYDITDPQIKQIYEWNINKSLVRQGEILNQQKLEDEVKRVDDLMRQNGFYSFNDTNQEIYFTADTLSSRKQVPLMMKIDSTYKKATIGKIDVAVIGNVKDYPKNTTTDSLRGVNFHKIDNQYSTRSLWLPVTIKNGEIYDQKNLDLTRRNLLAMNNFSILSAQIGLRNGGKAPPNDSIIDVLYLLKPLPKYELKVATDVNYSQLLNLGISPSVDLTSRNVFGGAENLSSSISGTFGSIRSAKNLDKRSLAYEISTQFSLNFPRLLLPFTYWQIIPKRFSPTSSVSVGASVQNNIGLGRINFNGGLNYLANVEDRVTHRFSIFNTQLSLTQNKDKYFDYFPADAGFRQDIFNLYFVSNPAVQSSLLSGQLTNDQVSAIIYNDGIFSKNLNADQLNTYNNFVQSLFNKERQTQDVLISSLIYNYTYNEIGKKEYENPFFVNTKIEVAGNLLSLISKKSNQNNVFADNTKTIFNIPYSQFVKFDLEFRKYFTFNMKNGFKNTLAFRQLIGVGIPYGNSQNMPFVRSYFNGGSNDIRAWTAFGGLGPADSQLDERVRSYFLDNVKLTTSVEYRMPFTQMFEGAIFTDAGNIWGLKDNGLGDQFKFGKFLSQMGVGSGVGLRINVAYITLRLDLAYKIYDPNKPAGDRWRFSKIQPFKPTLNFAFGYPF
ncbi:MAG: BamA/TamA family outer membrane protein [Chryseobacterium sp.]|nr:BamA/TamA family outer membrane protein [Chryseobacterium sp.]